MSCTVDDILADLDSLPGPLPPDDPVQVLALGVRDLRTRLAAAAKRIRELEEAARPFSYSKQYTPDWETWDRLRRVLGLEVEP